jgi:hypothetical protein
LLPASIRFEQCVCGGDELSHHGGDAILAGFPAMTSCWYLAFRSGLLRKRCPERIHPVNLSITHNWFSGEFCAKLNVHEPRPPSPHDHVAGRRIVPST